MTISDLDPEDNLLEPLGNTETRPFFTRIPGGAAAISTLVLTCTASFGLGLLCGHSLGIQGGGLTVGSIPSQTDLTASGVNAGTAAAGSSVTSQGVVSNGIPAGGGVVGQASTKKYYLPWCPEVATISPGDSVSFASADAAQAKGYTAGTGCPGQ